MKVSFYEELERVFNRFLTYHMKILLGDFIAKMRREHIFKPTIGTVSLYEISNDNGARVVNYIQKSVKSTKFPHHNIYKFTRTVFLVKDRTIDNVQKHNICSM
jgi:hypothetical protein